MSKTRSRRKRQNSSSVLTSPAFLLTLGLTLVIVGVLLVLNQSSGGQALASSETRDDAAPLFTLPGLDGEQLSLGDYRGQYVLVNFWATWCPPCRAELPDLVSYYKQHADSGFMLIGVNEQEPPAVVNAFLRQNNLDFPVVLDGNGSVMQAYGVTGMPSSFLVNPEGQIVRMWTGMINRITLESAITPLLQNQS
ncbi:MAG: hypothetical protein Kow0077_24410 [Anaerolineae bacterium]